jgi:anti-sigma B factor antagonist
MNSTESGWGAFAVGASTVDGVTVLEPSGSLTYESCPELRSAIDQIPPSSHRVVVLDCSLVKAIDSEGLELLVRLHETLRLEGGRLKLCTLNDVCSHILVAVRLVHILSVYDDVKQAVQSGGR